MLFLERSGFREETYHTFSYSPLTDDDGTIAGMLCVVSEDTGRVIGDRRMATLRDLGADPTDDPQRGRGARARRPPPRRPTSTRSRSRSPTCSTATVATPASAARPGSRPGIPRRPR